MGEFLFEDASGRRSATFDGDLYAFFVNVAARRWFPPPTGGIAKDSIISLNYDLLLEQALGAGPHLPLYDLPADRLVEQPPDVPTICRLRLLKLHGSAN